VYQSHFDAERQHLSGWKKYRELQPAGDRQDERMHPALQFSNFLFEAFHLSLLQPALSQME
jgi:hypothetical protein